MLKDLMRRFREEDKKMIEEAIRASPPESPSKRRWLTIVFWCAILMASVGLYVLVYLKRQ